MYTAFMLLWGHFTGGTGKRRGRWGGGHGRGKYGAEKYIGGKKEIRGEKQNEFGERERDAYSQGNRVKEIG